MAEGLEDILAMSHFRMCVPHNTFGQDGFLADQRDSDSGSETAIGDMINTIQGLDDEVLEFVGGYDGLCCSGETLDDKGEDGGLNGAPGGCRVGVLSPGSAAFVDEFEGCNHFGETLAVFEEADDEVGGQVGRPGSDEVEWFWMGYCSGVRMHSFWWARMIWVEEENYSVTRIQT